MTRQRLFPETQMLTPKQALEKHQEDIRRRSEELGKNCPKSLPAGYPRAEYALEPTIEYVRSQLEQNGWEATIKKGICGDIYLRVKPNKGTA